MTLPDDLPHCPFARARRAQAAARKRLLARRKAALTRRLADWTVPNSAKAPAAPDDGAVRSQTQRVGAHYERRALAYLRDAGLRLLVQNPRCRMGEIDLVMRQGDTLVLVEVRARRSAGFGGAGASITAAKQRRLTRAAAFLMPGLLGLMARDLGVAHVRPPVRFDVVTFEGDTIQWVAHAFALP